MQPSRNMAGAVLAMGWMLVGEDPRLEAASRWTGQKAKATRAPEPAGLDRNGREALMHDEPPRYLGVMMADAAAMAETSTAAWTVGVPERGAYVLAVDPAGPGAAAGLREGDVVTAIGGRRVGGAADVFAFLAGHKIGTKVPVVYLRRGELRGSSFVVAEPPDERGPPSDSAGRLGVTVRTQPPPSTPARKSAPRADGALVTSVEPDSPAARAGLRPGDTIVAVDRRRVRSAREAAAALRIARERPRVLAVMSAKGKKRAVRVPPLAAGR